MDFLVDLSAKLDNLQDDEIATMLALKKIDEGDSFNGKLHAWDSLYYRNKVRLSDPNECTCEWKWCHTEEDFIFVISHGIHEEERPTISTGCMKKEIHEKRT